MVDDNHNLIYGLAHKKRLNLDDCYGILALALCNAALHFDENKGKFSTFAYTYMINAIKNYKKSVYSKDKISMISLDADYTSNEDNESGELFNVIICDNLQPDLEIEDKESCVMLMNTLNEKEKQVVNYKMNGLSEKTIAEKMGCSQQNINVRIKRIRKKWNNFYCSINKSIY